MILSQESIERYLKEGKIKIHPFIVSHLKEASYTFTLQDSLVMNPGEFKIALSKEKITLSKDVCCFLSTRGSIAQQGIDALQSSTFVEPLSDNQLKLEIKNNSGNRIELEADIPIVKIVFMKVE